MDAALLRLAIDQERDIVLVRQRARRLAEIIGFDTQDQTRITTAVSEVARNALEYARHGQVQFRLTGAVALNNLTILVRDRGPGIANLPAVLSGAQKSMSGMGMGLLGAQRLMDHVDISTRPGAGTTVRLAKQLPTSAPPITPAILHAIIQALSADGTADAMAEIRRQNQQILMQMDEMNRRQEELERLNQELQDTNRGVVALYAELEDRAERLNLADQLKSKFLSHTSHEFRTPLNSVLALSNLLLQRSEGELTAAQETQVRFILKAAEGLTELVDNLLDLARVESGKTTVVVSQFAAAGLFGVLRGMLRPLLIGDSVALLFEEPGDLPLLETDEAKVSQILRNLISNAIKFTERGEVSLAVSADPQADTIIFSVRDTGIGIATHDLELIFQEFGQVAHPLQTKVKGSGLGLPLAEKLAKLLGGRIAVESIPGQGSVFTLTVPRRYAAPQEPADAPAEHAVQPGTAPVLVVGGDPADVARIGRMLAASPYQPVATDSARQTLDMLRRVQPAATLLNVTGEEGCRLLLQIRNTEADIPMIAFAAAEEQSRFVHLGADGCLMKPLQQRELIDLLDRLTGRQPTTGVLLIEDEEVARYLVRQLLPRGRYNLSAVASGEDGLEHLRSNHADVVLLDINLPGMSGYEFLDRVTGDAELADIPIIVLTSAILSAGQRDRLCRAGMILSKGDLSSATLVSGIDGVLHPFAAIDAAPGSARVQ